jgi:hypothetical protein
MKNMEFLDVSNLIGQGFFADKVVRILCKPGPITPNDENVLKRVEVFLNKIVDGQKQASSEKLSSTSVETIDAYQKALIIFSQALLQQSEKLTAPKFQELIDRMCAEVEEVLREKEVTPDVRTTLNFFKYLQRQTADETSDYISKRAVLKWPTPATFSRF